MPIYWEILGICGPGPRFNAFADSDDEGGSEARPAEDFGFSPMGALKNGVYRSIPEIALVMKNMLINRVSYFRTNT